MSTGSRFVKLFISQLGFKLLSFALTSLLTRALIPEAKGVGFFFEMYFLAAGFMSREAVRSLHARLSISSSTSSSDISKKNNKDGDDNDEKRKEDLIFSAFLGSGLFCAVVALFIIVPLCILHASYTINSELYHVLIVRNNDDSNNYLSALSCCFVLVSALIIELLGETQWNLIIGRSAAGGGIGGRATGESVSLLSKTIVTTAIVRTPVLAKIATKYVFWFSSSNHSHNHHEDAIQTAVAGFALGHLTYGVVNFLFSARELRKCDSSIITNDNNNNDNKIFYKQIPLFKIVKPSISNLRASIKLYSSSSVFIQFVQENILRLILTEGEKFVVSSAGVVSLAAQGAFDVATSLGALVARLLFRLWEEFAFNEWAKMSSSSSTADSSTQALELLHNLCRVAIIVGVLSCCFGPLLSGRILLLLFGSTWANRNAVNILTVFLFVLPLFGLNGLIEAFGRALASPEEMKRTRTQLLGVSFLYLSAAFCSLKYWSEGDVKMLIAVNGLQFVLRIVIGLFSARRITSNTTSVGFFLRGFIPSFIFIFFTIGLTSSFWFLFDRSNQKALFSSNNDGVYSAPLKQDLIIIGGGVLCVIVAVLTEPQAMNLIKGFVARRRANEEKNKKE